MPVCVFSFLYISTGFKRGRGGVRSEEGSLLTPWKKAGISPLSNVSG